MKRSYVVPRTTSVEVVTENGFAVWLSKVTGTLAVAVQMPVRLLLPQQRAGSGMYNQKTSDKSRGNRKNFWFPLFVVRSRRVRSKNHEI